MQQNRRISSFGRRKGRVYGKEKGDLLADLLPQLEIKPPSGKQQIHPKEFFDDDNHDKKIWLEIGFGNGEHLLHQVVNNPDIAIIGGEVYTHGIAALLKNISNNESAKSRIRIFPDDIRILLEHIKPESIEKVFILFPDPWPKRKQNKRRLIKQDLLLKLSEIMKDGGELHIATDHHEYAEWILLHILKSNKFHWNATSKSDWLTPPAHHIETRYQIKNKAQTDYPVFLNFKKTSTS